MQSKQMHRLGRSVLTLLGAGGFLFAGTCSSSDIAAVAAGVEAAFDQLGGRRNSNDISFRDFLIDELEDL